MLSVRSHSQLWSSPQQASLADSLKVVSTTGAGLDKPSWLIEGDDMNTYMIVCMCITRCFK
ncbi:hypothetical protein C0Q70_08539, partial [Pomacea canaliculata]